MTQASGERPALLLAAGTDPASFVHDLRSSGFALFDVDADAGCVSGTYAEALLERVRPEHGDRADGYRNLLCVQARR